MGAESFCVSKKARTAKGAFQALRKEALYWHGHAGYTGTIAEKDGFVMVDKKRKPDETIGDFIHRMFDEDGEEICDKWGPACCIKNESKGGIDTGYGHFDKGEYIFFGWASS